MWRDNLQLEGKGSWRGVEFFVDTTESEVGRRVVVHEYPGRDTPDVEDIGRQTRRFKLTCFVLGDQYDVDRDLLRDEFEKAGDGELVHPYWGTFTCRVTSPVRIREVPTEGGMCRFDLELVEIEGKALTQTQPDLEPIVDTKADAVNAAASSTLEKGFSLTDAIESVRSAAVSNISALTQKIREVRRTTNAALSIIDDTADAISELADTAAQLILLPEQLAASIQGIAGSVFGAIATLDAATAELIALGGRLVSPTDGRLFDDFRANRALEAFRALSEDPEESGDLEPVPDTGSSQDVIQAENQRQIAFTFRAAAAAEGARALAGFDFTSRTTVLLVRDEVTTTLDALAHDADDELWASLTDLREAFRRRMDELGASLPEIIDHTPPETRPALCIAYDLYADATRDAEIVALNEIENPNFVPGLETLKVIANG